MVNHVDVTPTPRVLRVLGELPFEPWQCFAELIDNAVDAFNTYPDAEEKTVNIVWSSERLAQADRTIEIIDNAGGMTLEQMTNAVKAGYSSNDPLDNLGLFGLGFNIATAKLGEKTVVYSTRAGDPHWIGVEIDFTQLIKQHSFNAPVVYMAKESINDHGTKIIISNLNSGIHASLRSKESAIRKRLENVYSSLLSRNGIELYVQGKRLQPKKHCVWSEERFVIRDGRRIYAIQKIDRVLGETYFDLERNKYLTPDQEDDLRLKHSADALPAHIVKRQKRLKGWVGIQRFFDTNEFGIDFIRNGRKILMSNKEVFSFENPYTGTSILQYPVELGSTVGGRIVGEVEVDYLIPTYQKNDFDRTDISWMQTLEALRGVGPILPKLRKSLGYTDDNVSPCGLLANAYRRTEKGSKNLAVSKAVAAEFYGRFLKNDPEYINDERWWQAVLEADRENASGGAGTAGDVDHGDVPSDDIGDYIGTTPTTAVTPMPSSDTTQVSIGTTNTQSAISSTCDALLTNSEEYVTLSRRYAYDNKPAFNVKVHRMNCGQRIYQEGNPIPCAFFSNGIECDFFYDENHEILAQYPNTPENLLLTCLAKKFAARDGKSEIEVYAKLTVENFKEYRLDKSSLKDQAAAVFDLLREKLITALSHKYTEILECIMESSGETEETLSAMISDNDMLQAFRLKTSDSIGALSYTPAKTLIRLVSKFPEDVFDGKVFSALYSTLPEFQDQNAKQRLQESSKERIVSLMKDAQAILNDSTSKLSKNELTRYSLSLSILKGVIA